jgi:hypothetical protein
MLRRYRSVILTITVLSGLLAWAVWIMIQMWTSIEGNMGVHEWTAMILGIFFSCLVGFGLMALMFYNTLKGDDEPPIYVEEYESDTYSAVNLIINRRSEITARTWMQHLSQYQLLLVEPLLAFNQSCTQH